MLWNAIEKLAKSQGLTCSGLAKRSGLDATTFNKSKQFSPDGTPRWPSCGTIAKIIRATNITIFDFAALCSGSADK
jgi:phage repressor protein C with HTH and peptisase S24 domain